MFHFLLCFLLSQCPTFSFFYFFFTLSFSFSSPKLHSLLLPLNIFSHFFTLSLLPSPPLPSSPPYSSFRHHNLLLPLLFPSATPPPSLTLPLPLPLLQPSTPTQGRYVFSLLIILFLHFCSYFFFLLPLFFFLFPLIDYCLFCL